MPANFTGSLAISGSLILTGSISALGGITISGSIDSASFAATASSADNFFVRQNLTASSALFTGSITAQTLVVQTVTSSIVYSSGSNIFGNLPSNVQQFTGSLRVSGSGVHYIQGGCFGIGLDTPTNRLTVDSSGYPLLVSNDTGNRRVYIGTEVNGEPAIQATLSNGTVRQLVLQPAGSNVGIGTSSPTRKLTIEGCGVFGATTGASIRLNNTTSGRFSIIDMDDSENLNIWGSTDVSSVRFYTNSASGTLRMIISSSGNVGIGTCSPLAKLSVGNGSLADDNLAIQISSAGSATEKYIGFNKNGAYGLIIGYYENTSLAGSGSYIRQVNSDPLHFNVNNTSTAMTILCNANVGIGTTSPTYKLQVADAGVPAVGIYRDLDVTSVGPAGQFIEFGARCGTTFIPGAAIAGALDNPSTTGILVFQTRCNNSLSTKMTISACGFVGIGTTAPGDILTVASTTYRGLTLSTSIGSARPTITFLNTGGNDSSYIQGNCRAIAFGALNSDYGGHTEYVRITSDGYVAITGNQALKCVPYLQGMSFGWNRSNGQGESMINWTNQGGGTNTDLTFNFWDNTALCERMRLTSSGILAIGTTSTSTEANLFLGAQGTVEGGQLVLQKGTSCSCATHLDNYQNTFRIMSGTDTGSTMVNMVVNHVNGQVGIGLTPSYQLDVQLPSGTNGQIIRLGRSAGAYYWSLGIDSVGSCLNFYNNSNTSVAVINPTTGVYTATSDCRLKSNITDSCTVLDKILQVKVRQYIWNESCEKEDYGLIAQEVNEVLPQYVKQGDENTNWGVSKSEFVPALIKAIQEQQCQICTQSMIINQLKTCLGIV